MNYLPHRPTVAEMKKEVRDPPLRKPRINKSPARKIKFVPKATEAERYPIPSFHNPPPPPTIKHSHHLLHLLPLNRLCPRS